MQAAKAPSIVRKCAGSSEHWLFAIATKSSLIPIKTILMN